MQCSINDIILASHIFQPMTLNDYLLLFFLTCFLWLLFPCLLLHSFSTYRKSLSARDVSLTVMGLLGNHWPKPPALARQDDNCLPELSQQEVLIRNMVLPPKTNRENLRGAKRERRWPTSQSSLLWNPSWLLDAHATRKDPESDYGPRKMTGQRHKTWDCEPHGRAVLLGSLTLLLSTPVPLPNKVFCFVSTCVSLDNSFPSVRQEPTLRPWKGFPFLQQALANFYLGLKLREPDAWNCKIIKIKSSFLTVGIEWSYFCKTKQTKDTHTQ